ncbi:MAG: helix-turn-helix domain-containing protein [Conexivisphaerales archaeon]
MEFEPPEETLSAFKRLGLTKEQVKMYGYLVMNGPKTVSEICREMNKDPAAAYKHLEKLLKPGLIDRGLDRRDDSYMLISDRNLGKSFIRLFDTIYLGLGDAGPLLSRQG